MTHKANYTQTYWSSKGKYPELNEALQKLIPDEGPVANAKKNRALEKFRKASNEFRGVFGFGGRYGRGGLTQTILDRTEAEMDRIILSAAKEQGMVVPEQANNPIPSAAPAEDFGEYMADQRYEDAAFANKPKVQLTGEDGNAFFIIARCGAALKKAGQEDKAKEFTDKAFNAGSYDEVLRLAMTYCDVS